jgi:hypothetical protein
MCNLLSLKSGNMDEWKNVGTSEAHIVRGELLDNTQSNH